MNGSMFPKYLRRLIPPPVAPSGGGGGTFDLTEICIFGLENQKATPSYTTTTPPLLFGPHVTFDLGITLKKII